MWFEADVQARVRGHGAEETIAYEISNAFPEWVCGVEN